MSATTPRRVYAANLYYTILLFGMVKIGQEGTQGEVGRPIMPTYFSRGGGGDWEDWESGGGETGQETQSDPTIASSTRPTNLFVHAAPYVQLSRSRQWRFNSRMLSTWEAKKNRHSERHTHTA